MRYSEYGLDSNISMVIVSLKWICSELISSVSVLDQGKDTPTLTPPGPYRLGVM